MPRGLTATLISKLDSGEGGNACRVASGGAGSVCAAGLLEEVMLALSGKGRQWTEGG